MAQKGKFTSIKSVLDKYDFSNDKKYISREFQDYGCRLADELGDPNHKSLYIKLAKTVDRMVLERARSFVKDAENVRSRPKLFMWKIKQLKKELGQKTSGK